MKKIILTLVASSVLLSGCKLAWFDNKPISLTDTIQDQSTPVPAENDPERSVVYDQRNLVGFWSDPENSQKDVSFQLKPTAYPTSEKEVYHVLAKLNGWQAPKAGTYYQGWLVETNNQKMIKTSKFQKIGNEYVDAWELGTELKSYKFYLVSQESGENPASPTQELVRIELIDPTTTVEY